MRKQISKVCRGTMTKQLVTVGLTVAIDRGRAHTSTGHKTASDGGGNDEGARDVGSELRDRRAGRARYRRVEGSRTHEGRASAAGRQNIVAAAERRSSRGTDADTTFGRDHGATEEIHHRSASDRDCDPDQQPARVHPGRNDAAGRLSAFAGYDGTASSLECGRLHAIRQYEEDLRAAQRRREAREISLQLQGRRQGQERRAKISC